MMDKLGEGLKNVILAGIGAMTTGFEKSQQTVEQLVKRGEISIEQGKILNEELKRKTPEAKVEAEKIVCGRHTDQADAATPEDATPENAASTCEQDSSAADFNTILADLERLSPAQREELQARLKTLKNDRAVDSAPTG